MIFSASPETAESAHLPGGEALTSALSFLFFHFIDCQNINMEHRGLTFKLQIGTGRGELKGKGVI